MDSRIQVIQKNNVDKFEKIVVLLSDKNGELVQATPSSSSTRSLLPRRERPTPGDRTGVVSTQQPGHLPCYTEYAVLDSRIQSIQKINGDSFEKIVVLLCDKYGELSMLCCVSCIHITTHFPLYQFIDET